MFANWKIFSFTRRRPDQGAPDHYHYREPFDHPEVARMTLRELADLPMPRGR